MKLYNTDYLIDNNLNNRKMDHISANKTLTVTERENVSGARVFDGEDQGKLISIIKWHSYVWDIVIESVLVRF